MVGVFLLLILSGLALAAPTPVREQVIREVRQRLGPQAVAAATSEYVGSEACLGCHTNLKEMRASLHFAGLKHAKTDKFSMQLKNGIIADYDRNGVDDFKQGLDFNKISSVFDKYKPAAPILGYKADKGYTITIAGVEYLVGFVHGGSGLYKQRFVLRFPVTDTVSGFSADYYYSPVQFNETYQSYVLYSDNYWWNADGSPKITSQLSARQAAAAGKSFNKDCVGCHSTSFGGVEQDANGEWVVQTFNVAVPRADDPHALDLNDDGIEDGYNIGCERCHGPGSRHIMLRGDPKAIIRPAQDFTAMQQNELCGSCHSRGTSADGKHEYPMSLDGEDYGKHLGESLYTKFWTDKPGLWPDGKTSRQHHQQLQDLMKSSKWEFQFHKVTCNECHDVHNADRGHIRREMPVTIDGKQTMIKVSVEDNTLCLACHVTHGPFAQLKPSDLLDPQANWSTIAGVVSEHSKHPYSPQAGLGLSRCTECHMAKMATSGEPYDISSHTFEAVAPEKTVKFAAQGGMPNSCAVRCHRPLAPAYGLRPDASFTNWSESADLELARWLMQYYGPNGAWWKTN